MGKSAVRDPFVPKIVVAIDFGTHGSGFAWATVSDLQDLAKHRSIVYKDFTAQGGSNSYPKDLTTVLVDVHGEAVAFGFEARRRWQAESRGNPNGFGYAARFKMALRADAPPADVPRFLGSLAGADHTVVRKLIAAYLRRLYTTALQEIEATSFGGIGFSAQHIRWCITVPAIWTDSEKRAMRDAAKAAGIPSDEERLLLVSEPEAAAVYCALTSGTLLEPDRPEGRLSVETPGSRFMVVDCGGGTVDITSYQIRPEGVGDDRLAEIGIADGGRLGSAYINQHFVDEVLGDRFGDEELKALLVSHPQEIAALEDRWEGWKVGLHSETGPDGTPVFTMPCDIEVPGRLWEALSQPTRERLTELAYGEPYHLVILPHEIAALHESVVGRILETIEGQRRIVLDNGPVKGVDQIIMVGGFARSTYLRDRIAQRFGGKVTVIMPQDPAVAVLGGAVHFAYDPAVIRGRRSKFTYGFECAMSYREGTDPEGLHFRDELGDDMCNDRFHVMVKRGAQVTVGEVVKATIRVQSSSVVFDLGLFATYSDDPQYINEAGCERVGTVTADTSGSVKVPFPKRYLDIYYTFGGTEIAIETQDRTSGVRRKATIEFTELHGRRGRDRTGG
ncbi:Hsp70 family protein [Streptomyces qinzhouensis]|uniref:Hsp70 family protein n=1 Tax=Streptomyces qinzhouensis TaxID=2599401 RepID=A0A5B8JD54_9ACTN|nr:Hsp70 family protein [Streptomyces qinzhouensis]QDY77881.1 Hsp70 family protein [Streptomyces qinzhouensis]